MAFWGVFAFVSVLLLSTVHSTRVEQQLEGDISYICALMNEALVIGAAASAHSPLAPMKQADRDQLVLVLTTSPFDRAVVLQKLIGRSYQEIFDIFALARAQLIARYDGHLLMRQEQLGRTLKDIADTLTHISTQFRYSRLANIRIQTLSNNFAHNMNWFKQFLDEFRNQHGLPKNNHYFIQEIFPYHGELLDILEPLKADNPDLDTVIATRMNFAAYVTTMTTEPPITFHIMFVAKRSFQGTYYAQRTREKLALNAKQDSLGRSQRFFKNALARHQYEMIHINHLRSRIQTLSLCPAQLALQPNF